MAPPSGPSVGGADSAGSLPGDGFQPLIPGGLRPARRRWARGCRCATAGPSGRCSRTPGRRRRRGASGRRTAERRPGLAGCRFPATESPISRGRRCARKPRSTSSAPVLRLMALIGMSFGRSWSNAARSCCGPSTQPQVASWNGAPTFFSASKASLMSAHGGRVLLAACCRPTSSLPASRASSSPADGWP